eukprot:13197796-Alexandrium_andersonii.AAC.1
MPSRASTTDGELVQKRCKGRLGASTRHIARNVGSCALNTHLKSTESATAFSAELITCSVADL